MDSDPLDQFLLLAALQQAAAAESPAALARLQVEMAERLLSAGRQGRSGLKDNAQYLLREALDPLRTNLPSTREVLVQAHYLLGDSYRGQDWVAARTHFAAGLELVRRDEEVVMWLALTDGLAASLARASDNDEPDQQERSIRLYQDALTVLPPQVAPGYWAETAEHLVLTLRERHRGGWLENWMMIHDLAIRAFAQIDLARINPGENELRWRIAVQMGQARTVVAIGCLLTGAGWSEAHALRMLDDGLAWQAAAGIEINRQAQQALCDYAAAGHPDDPGVMVKALGGARDLLAVVGDRRGQVLVLRRLAQMTDGAEAAAYGSAARQLASPFDDDGPPSVGEVESRTPPSASDFPATVSPQHEQGPGDDPIRDGLAVLAYAMAAMEDDVVDSPAVEVSISGVTGWLERTAEHTEPARLLQLRRHALATLGQLYGVRKVGSPGENAEHAIRWLGAAAKLDAEDHRPSAETLHTLGVLLKNRRQGSRADNVEEAIGVLKSALAASDPREHPAAWASTASQLGVAYAERRRGDRAENLERALDWYRQALPLRPRERNAVRWAWTMHNIGSTLIDRQLGDRKQNLTDARRYLLGALEVRTAEARPEHRAITLSALADCEMALVEFEPAQAGQRLEAAIEALQGAAGVLTPDQDRSRWLVNRVRLGRAHLRRAGELSDEAKEAELDVARDAAGQVLLTISSVSDPEIAAMAHQLLAATFLARPQTDDTATQAEAELKVATECAGRAGLRVPELELLIERAALLRRRARWEPAATLYTEAAGLADALVVDTVSLTTLRTVLPGLTNLRPDAAYAYARSPMRAAASAAVLLEAGRAQAARLWSSSFAADLSGLAGFGDDGAYAQRCFLDAATRVEELTAQEVRAGGLGGAVPPPGLLEDGRIARRDLDYAIARVRRFPGLGDFLTPPTLQTLIAAAQPGRPLVYLYAGDSGGQVIVLHWEEGSPAVLTSDLEITSSQVDWLLFGAGPQGAGLFGAALEGGASLDATLAETLPLIGFHLSVFIASLLKRLGAQKALIVPYGRLSALPLAAAPVKADGGLHLHDVAAVSVVPSAQLLNATRRAGRSADAARRSYLGIANPTGHRSPLLWAEPEVWSVASQSAEAAVVVGADATIDHVLTGCGERAVVHLACHGSFDPIDVERSRLVLADGDLSLARLVQTKAFAGTRLVVASACDSGASELRLADESTGLLTSFLLAGARYALGALWPVDDLAAALLGARVAAACLDPSSDPPEELAKAQSWLRKLTREEATAHLRALAAAVPDDLIARGGQAWHEQRLDALARIQLGGRAHPFASPRYWAAFVVVGG